MAEVPLRPPDLAEARALLAAVEEGSLARAGVRLGVSQPAMSKRIRNLEALTGTPLLERGARGVRPTAAGRRLAGDAARLVAEADRFAQAAAALRAGAPPLRVAVIYSVAESVLPRWLAELRDRAGAGPVEVRVGTPAQVRGWVQAGESDVGVAAGPGDGAGLEERVIGRDDLVALAPAGHPWARAGVVDAAELARTPLCLRERGSGTRDVLEAALAAAGLPAPVAALTLGSTPAIRAAVAAQGIPAVVSGLVLPGAPGPGDPVAVAVRGADLARPLTALWRRGTRLTRPQRAFLAAAGAGGGPGAGW
jgi:DNA-binding transcriptional LysR family regulator